MVRWYLVIGAGVLAAIGGVWLTRDWRLPDATLEGLFDACADFARTGTTGSLSALGLTPDERGRMSGRFAVEGGIVTVELRGYNSLDTAHTCFVHGETETGSDRAKNASLTWRASKARTDAWFLRMESEPGLSRGGYVLRPEDHLLYGCPKDGQGFSINGGSLGMDSDSSVSGPDLPLLFAGGRSSHDNTLACITLKADGG
jgi:hypothetical protein